MQWKYHDEKNINNGHFGHAGYRNKYSDSRTRGRGGCDRDGIILGRLNLTPGQMEKIRLLKESYQNDRIPIQNQVFNKRLEIKILWMQLKPDLESIKTKQKEIQNLRWQLKEKCTDYRLAFRNILTPIILVITGAQTKKEKNGKTA